MALIMNWIEWSLDLLSHFGWRSERSSNGSYRPTPPPFNLSPPTLSPKRDLKKIVAPVDLPYYFSIGYAYDPVPEPPSYISNSPLVFPRCVSKPCSHISDNTIQVNPHAAGLPYRSGFNLIRGSRHWKANLDETVKVLEMIAEDNSTTDVEMSNGLTLAELAKKQLLPGLEHRMVIATTFMFPSASERRVRIIATLMIMYFIFDGKIDELATGGRVYGLRLTFLGNLDKIEETPEGAPLIKLREEFFAYFKVPAGTTPSGSTTTTDLQRHLEDTMRGIAEEDGVSGNGGIEMVDALHGAFRCVHPPEKGFNSLEDYLSFRRLNVGARYLGLIGDHLGIVNDIASYEKEARALREGTTLDMINIVAVLQNLMSLPDSVAAKGAAYVYQLQVEAWIVGELDALVAHGRLTDEEWWFLEAVFLSVSGNTFFCMTSSRYGGKAAAI
ncbi:hypothetical protein IFR05_015310 [Cadophora sp. M221]|nr:hypothetical protein IFR05_015310 [Cadophora sp. M221]